ncbi:restriction endonuclease [Streptomyces sp. NPDC087437]|uniref:restriction endonuclease n=1 Tax=Streptomyces sp. NPDC087437 TaxID=3365789 RepID=UPI00381E1F9D
MGTVIVVVAVGSWLLAHRWSLVAVGVLAVLAGCGWLYQRRRSEQREAARAKGLRYTMPQLDALDHSRFGEAVRELMRRDGCWDARIGPDDALGADVKATDPYGRRWVIQCEHRHNGLAGSAVGLSDLQVLDATARRVHGADVAVIMTNGQVTAPAVAFAEQQRLHVADRHTLDVWASTSRPLWELLEALPPPRKPTTAPVD